MRDPPCRGGPVSVAGRVPISYAERIRVAGGFMQGTCSFATRTCSLGEYARLDREALRQVGMLMICCDRYGMRPAVTDEYLDVLARAAAAAIKGRGHAEDRVTGAR